METADQPTLAPSWQELLDSTLTNSNLTEAQRAVFDDGWVTDEEWAEMVNVYMTCLADQGIEGVVGTVNHQAGVSPATQALYREKYGDIHAAFAVLDPIIDRCVDLSIGPVGIFYFYPRDNPDGLSHEDLVGACMRRVGLDEYAQLTRDEIVELSDSASFAFEHPEGADCIRSPSATDWRNGK